MTIFNLFYLFFSLKLEESHKFSNQCRKIESKRRINGKDKNAQLRNLMIK